MLQCEFVGLRGAMCVAVCCSVLQCAATGCSMLQCEFVGLRGVMCVAVCCSVLQHDAVCCNVNSWGFVVLSKLGSYLSHTHCNTLQHTATHIH